MNSRPYVLLGEGALAAHRTRASDALARWVEAWGLPALELAVACEPAARERFVALDREELEREIAAAWGSAGRGGAPVLRDVVTAAVGDLLEALERDGATTRPGEELFARASGAVTWQVRIGAARLSAACAHVPPAVKPVADSGHGIASVRDAVDGATVTVAAEIGAVDLALATMQSLACGDVIRLGTRLAEPLAIVAADGTRVCGGHLGAHGGHRALELVP